MQLTIPSLAQGEAYLGVTSDNQGNCYHSILLSYVSRDASWSDQMAWAKSLDADLPTRAEMRLIWERHSLERTGIGPTGLTRKIPPVHGISTSTLTSRHPVTNTMNYQQSPSADCPFNHSIILRQP